MAGVVVRTPGEFTSKLEGAAGEVGVQLRDLVAPSCPPMRFVLARPVVLKRDGRIGTSRLRRRRHRAPSQSARAALRDGAGSNSRASVSGAALSSLAGPRSRARW